MKFFAIAFCVNVAFTDTDSKKVSISNLCSKPHLMYTIYPELEIIMQPNNIDTCHTNYLNLNKMYKTYII